MTLILLLAAIGTCWFCFSPKAPRPRTVKGTKSLVWFIVGIVATVLFYNTMPMPLIPIFITWFVVFKAVRSNKEVKDASPAPAE